MIPAAMLDAAVFELGRPPHRVMVSDDEDAVYDHAEAILQGAGVEKLIETLLDQRRCGHLSDSGTPGCIDPCCAAVFEAGR